MIPKSLVRHIKSSNTYRILNIGVDCTNARDNTPVVIYFSVTEPERLFVRELGEFRRKFEPVL